MHAAQATPPIGQEAQDAQAAHRAPAQWPDFLPAAALADIGDGVRWHTQLDGVQTVWHVWPPSTSAAPKGCAVLLHGGSGSWTHWLRNVSPLRAAGWCVVAPDLPGFGDSDVPPDTTDAPALVAHVHSGLSQLMRPPCSLAPGPVQVVGFSFGAMVGALWLAQQPQVAQSLVLVGSPGLGLAVPVAPALKGWRHLPTLHEQDQVHLHNLQALMLAQPDSLDDLALDLHRANVQRDRMPRRKLSSTAIVAEHLPLISARVSAIYGERDALYINRLPLVQQTLARLAPHKGDWHVAAGAGHWVNHEAAATFNADLLAVLAASGTPFGTLASRL